MQDINFSIEAKEVVKALDKVWSTLAIGFLCLAFFSMIAAWLSPYTFRDCMQAFTLLFPLVWLTHIAMLNVKKSEKMERVAEKQIGFMQENEQHLRDEVQRLSNQLHEASSRLQGISGTHAALSKAHASLKQEYADALQRIADQKHNNKVLSDTLQTEREKTENLKSKCESLQKSNNALKRWNHEPNPNT